MKTTFSSILLLPLLFVLGALFNDSRQLIDKCWRNFASLFCTIADFDNVGELG